MITTPYTITEKNIFIVKRVPWMKSITVPINKKLQYKYKKVGNGICHLYLSRKPLHTYFLLSAMPKKYFRTQKILEGVKDGPEICELISHLASSCDK